MRNVVIEHMKEQIQITERITEAGFIPSVICDRLVEYYTTAIEAVKKQIPMKPETVDEELGFFVCGNCKSSICYMDEKETHQHCLKCGQKIDWSEDDGESGT